MNRIKYPFICAICGLCDGCYRARLEVGTDQWVGSSKYKSFVCINFNKFDSLFTVGGCFICGDMAIVKSFRNKCPENDLIRSFGVCSQHFKNGYSLIKEVERQTQVYLKQYNGKREQVKEDG